MSKILTKKKVQQYHEIMAKKYKFKIITKADTCFDEVFDVLKIIGIDRPRKFMDRCSITLGNRVYLSYKVGYGNQAALRQQICTVTHEAVHVCQYRAMGIRFYMQYVSNRTKRAGFEMRAIGVGMEMHHYLTGFTLSPASLARTLVYYNVNIADILTAKSYLSIRAKRVRKGQYRTRQSLEGVKVLKRLGVV